MRKIKSIETLIYNIALLEKDCYYKIIYMKNNKETTSEILYEYSMASYLFDVMLIELERNSSSLEGNKHETH